MSLNSRPGVVASLILLALGAGYAAAASANPQAEARARAHIAAYPAHSLSAPGHTFVARDTVIDEDGAEHVRFDRRYQGLRVIGGDMVVHSEANGTLRGMTRTLDRLPPLSGRPSIAAGVATAAALAAHANHSPAAKPELVIYARGDTPTLAYDVLVTGEMADGTPSEKHVIVDAHRWVVLDTWDDIQVADAPGTGNSFFVGKVSLTTDVVNGVFSLRDPLRGNTTTINMNNRTRGGSVFTDADNVWGTGQLSNTQTIGVDVQFGLAKTWDYFLNVHGRIGIANDGRGATGRAHYSRSYNNAFWSDSCFCMTFGDGDGVTFNPFAALDVAGHEMSHGVTSRTAGLIYSGESGGLNEATSDIFGTMVEFYANNPGDTPDYLIGEKLFKSGTSAIRSMIKPSLDGASADCWYSTVGNLDVHYSSGVANHFYYLLAEGTTNGSPSPTCVNGNTRTATGTGTLAGIGRAKAEKIWYRALTVYMTSGTNYAAARTATINAANDLYGVGSPESNSVAAAWSAVGRP